MNDVSVIIPTYNRALTIASAIQSVLNQTLPATEILICDDGSTDNSKQIVERFKDKRVIWVSGKHTGLPSATRNLGLMKAKGVWVAFLDSDDWWEKEKLHIQLCSLKSNNSLASCTLSKRVQGGKKIDCTQNFFKQRIMFSDLKVNNYITCSSVVINNKLLKNIGGFNEANDLKSIEDYELWLRVSCFTDFCYVSIPLVYYSEGMADSVRSVFTSMQVGLQRKIIWNSVSAWANHRKDVSFIRKTEIRLQQFYYQMHLNN